MKKIELNKASCELLEEGLINMVIKDYVEIDVEDMIAFREINKMLTGGKEYVVLFEAGVHSSFTKEARELVSSKEYGENRNAVALVIENMAQRIVGNFYININKPSTTTKIFISREEALVWLKKFI